jgi:hypothetical protein
MLRDASSLQVAHLQRLHSDCLQVLEMITDYPNSFSADHRSEEAQELQPLELGSVCLVPTRPTHIGSAWYSEWAKKDKSRMSIRMNIM